MYVESIVNLSFELNISDPLSPFVGDLRFDFDILPANVEVPDQTIDSTVNLRVVPIRINLKESLLTAVQNQIAGQIDNFFDTAREGKTLVNFGDDYQSLLLNWQYSSGRTDSIVGKLYQPLPAEVGENTDLFISRELVYSQIEQIFVAAVDTPATKVYLRPPNKRIEITGIHGQEVKPTNMEGLLSSTAFDLINPSDRLTEEWFTTALEGAELNVDYSNYNNFVFFSSAENRVLAFRNKLDLIEAINSTISNNSASLSLPTGSSGGLAEVTSSLVYPSLVNLANQKQEILRSFDSYERFLYYETGVPFSSSFETVPFSDEDDEFFDLVDVTWPKISGSVVSVTSSAAIDWMETQLTVARRYDDWNINRLVNNIPDYLRNDSESEPFRRFLDMTGHMYDTVKLYIDAMSDIFDRGNNPLSGLSQDLVWDIAKSLGIDLPNQYSIERALTYTLGDGGKIYRNSATETWKRFLHNQVYLNKTKGTKESLHALMNIYGVSPTTVQIRETSTPSLFYSTQSYETVEEQTISLPFTAAQMIEIPWAVSGNNPYTVEVRFKTTTLGQDQTIIDADGEWSLNLEATGSTYTLKTIVGGTGDLETYGLLPNTYYNVMLRYDGVSGASMHVRSVNSIGEYSSNITLTGSAILSSSWFDPTNIYLGAEFGAPPTTGLVGDIDEFRIWGEVVSSSVFDKWAKYPGIYSGNTTGSAASSLWARLSFNKPSLSITSSIVNESPYQRNLAAPSSMDSFTTTGFPTVATYPYGYNIDTRTIQKLSFNAGGSQFDNNKIKIVDAPVLKYFDNNEVPVLSRKNSIVSLKTKNENYTRANNVVGFYFSSTAATNDSILRSMGDFNLHNLIGDPRDQFKAKYDDLEDLNSYYWTTYAYNVNHNQFISFVNNLMSGMFKQAYDLVPARTKLLTGHVIESHVLERNKVQSKPLDLLENDYFATIEDDIVADISTAYDNYTATITENEQLTIVASTMDLTGLISENENNIISAESLGYNVIIEESEIYSIAGTVQNLSTTIDEYESTSFTAEYNTYASSIDLYANLFERAREVYGVAVSGGVVAPLPVYTPTYGPKSDFTTDPYGSTQFFQDPNGFIAVVRYDQVRYRNNILTDQGTWQSGSTYNINDVVTQSNVSGAASLGNDREYYAIRDNFISNIPPYLDRTYWRPVTYILVEAFDVKKAILINDQLTLVDSSSVATPVTGYRPNHYNFFRPTNTGYTRARYDGCVQTDASTSDGLPAVEIKRSAGDRLVVVDPDAPLQRPDSVTGPILDVT